MTTTPTPSTPDIRVNQLGENAYDIQVSQLANGNVLATWTYANQPMVMARLFTANGTPLGAEFRVNSLDALVTARPDIAATPDGGFAIVHLKGGHQVWLEQFTATGVRKVAGYVANPALVNFWAERPAVAALPDGRLVVTWATDNQSATKDADGDKSGVYAQIIGANGLPVGHHFLVNSVTDNWQLAPAVTSLTNGGFVIAWDTKAVTNNAAFGVYAQVYGAGGGRVGGQITLNTNTTGMQEAPALTALPGGGFVAVWQSHAQSGEADWGIYGQRFSATGARVGGEFHINTTTTNNQLKPVVTTLEDGGFVVLWDTTEFVASAGAWQVQIKGQRFDASGVALGDEFRVNGADIRSSTSNRADVIGLEDGGFMAAYLLQIEGVYGYGVFLRDFAPGDPPLPTGTPGNDNLTGSAGPDRMQGFAGADTITGLAGNDSLFGDAGADLLRGGLGNDRLYGGTENDRLEGGYGADLLWGEAGADRLYGQGGNDSLRGGLGGDLLDGGAGRDHMAGYGGNDTLLGGTYADTLDGGAGRDRLSGGGGADRLLGGTYADTLEGGTGNDRMTGGTGADDFVFRKGHGRDVITGFSVARNDELCLSANLWRGTLTAEQVIDRFGTRIDGDAALRFAGGEVVILDGLSRIAAIEDQIVIF